MKLKSRATIGIGSSVTRLLLTTLIAAALLFAPFGMAAAMAAAPADHHGQVNANDHCDGQVPQKQNPGSSEQPCCAAMCMAVVVEPAASREPIDFARAAERASLAERPHSYLADLPTPPPRRS